MRRTFNDLARHAKIEAIVTRSISGHLTERMQDHYSTVASEEQRTGISKVIDLFASRSAAAPEPRTGGSDPVVATAEQDG